MNDIKKEMPKSRSIAKKIFFYLLIPILAFWWLPFSLQKEENDCQVMNNNIIAEAFNHLEDQHMLEYGKVHIPLPMILYKKGTGFFVFSSNHLFGHHVHGASYKGFKVDHGNIIDAEGKQTVYNFSITKNMVWIILSMLFMLFLFIRLARYLAHRQDQPVKGLWNIPLAGVRFVRDNIAKENIGEKHYKRFTPYLLTLFFYILFCNIQGLLAGGANITGNISVTMTLSLCTFILVHKNASSQYWKHIFLPSVPIYLYPLIIPIEIISTCIQPIVLSARLFLNMLVGHIMILTIFGIMFIFNITFAYIITTVFIAFIILFKMVLATIQAYVFTLLASMSFGKAVAEH